MEINYCGCGSPMSNYDAEHSGKCSGCMAAHWKEKEEALAAERKEKIRREEEEKQREIQRVKDGFIKLVSCLEGRKIESAWIDSWTNAGGVEPESVTLHLDDGTNFTFEQNTYADGCMGHYDYYPYLNIYREG